MITMEYGVWAPDTVPPVVSIITNTTLTNQPVFRVDYLSDGVSKQTTFQLQEGENHLVIRESDPAGNLTEVQYPYLVTLDSIRPVIEVSSNLAVNNPNYTLAYTVDGTLKSIPKYLVEGDNEITIQEEDLAGNETVITVSIFLDTIPPALQFLSENITNRAEYILRYTTDGNLKEKLMTLLEGSNSIEVIERDGVNNESRATFFVTLDTIPPSGSVLINNNSAYTNQRDVTLTLSAQDATSGIKEMRFREDAQSWSDWQPFQAAMAMTLSETEGVHEIFYELKDNVGLISGFSDSIELDSIAPSGSILINEGEEYVTNSIVRLSLTGEDFASGVESMRFFVNGSWTPWESFQPKKTLSFGEDEGVQEILYELVDKAGSIFRSSDTIIRDSIPPTGSIQINQGDVFTYEKEVALTLTAQDATSGVNEIRFFVNGSWTDWEPSSATKTLTLPKGEGMKEVTLEIRDKAGLVSSFSDEIFLAKKISVDHAPSLRFTDLAFENATLELDFGDLGFETPATWSYSIDGAPFSTPEDYSRVKTLAFSEALGPRRIDITLFDVAGNTTRTFREEVNLEMLRAVSDFSPDMASKPLRDLVREGALRTDQRGNLLALYDRDLLVNQTDFLESSFRTGAPVHGVTLPSITAEFEIGEAEEGAPALLLETGFVMPGQFIAGKPVHGSVQLVIEDGFFKLKVKKPAQEIVDGVSFLVDREEVLISKHIPEPDRRYEIQFDFTLDGLQVIFESGKRRIALEPWFVLGGAQADSYLKVETENVAMRSVQMYGNTKKILSPKNELHEINYVYDTQGNLSEIEDQVHLSRLASPELKSISYDTKRTLDAQGRLLTATDKNGETLRFAYDDQGRVISTEELLTGRTTTASYEEDSNNNLTVTQRVEFQDGFSNSIQAVTKEVFNAEGRRTRLETSDGKQINFDELAAYSTQVAQVSQDSLAYSVTLQLDSRGRLLRRVTRNDIVEAFTYTLRGDGSEETRIQRHIPDVDRQGNPIAYETSERILTDREGRVLEKEDAQGRLTRFVYDAEGDVTRFEDGEGRVTTWTYQKNLFGQVIRSSKTFSYTDDFGNGVNAVTSQEFDSYGNLRAEVDSDGNARVYDFTFHALNHIPKTRTTYFYKNIASVDELALRHVFFYSTLTSKVEWDETGLVIFEKDSDSIETRTNVVRDSKGNVSSLTHTKTFTLGGVLVSQTQTQGFDLQGNLIGETDVLGNETRYTYDLLNQLLSTTYHLHNDASNQFDRVASSVKIRDARGILLATQEHESYKDGFGNLIETSLAREFDSFGNLTCEVGPTGDAQVIQYEFAVDGSIRAKTTYRYHSIPSLDDLKARHNAFPSALKERIEYDLLGEPKRHETFDEKIIVFITERDSLGKVVRQETQTASPTEQNGMAITTEVQEFDADGNLERQVFANGNEILYTYGVLGSLLASTLKNKFTDKDGIERIYEENTAFQETWSSAGLLQQSIETVESQDSFGNVFTSQNITVFDEFGEEIASIDPSGRGQITERSRFPWNEPEEIRIYEYEGVDTPQELQEKHRVSPTLIERTKLNFLGEILETENKDQLITRYDRIRLPDGLIQSQTRSFLAPGELDKIFVDEFDENGNRIRSTDDQGIITSYTFAPTGELLRKKEEGQAAHAIETVYTSLAYANGVTKLLSTSAQGIDRFGRIIDLVSHKEFTSRGELAYEVTEEDRGKVFIYEKDTSDRLIRLTTAELDEGKNYAGGGKLTLDLLKAWYNAPPSDFFPRITVQEWDTLGNETLTETQGEREEQIIDFNTLGTPREITKVSNSRRSLERYDTHGYLVHYEDGFGSVLDYTRGFDGEALEMTETKDGGNTFITTIYKKIKDSKGRLLSTEELVTERITKPDGSIETRTYDKGRNFGPSEILISRKDERGVVTTFNSDGDIVKVEDPAYGMVKTYEIDKYATGILKRKKESISVTATNVEGLPVTTTVVTESHYDTEGKLVRFVDSKGEQTLYAYTSSGETKTIQLPDGERIEYAYATDSSTGSRSTTEIHYRGTEKEFEVVKVHNIDGDLVFLSEHLESEPIREEITYTYEYWPGAERKLKRKDAPRRFVNVLTGEITLEYDNFENRSEDGLVLSSKDKDDVDKSFQYRDGKIWEIEERHAGEVFKHYYFYGPADTHPLLQHVIPDYSDLDQDEQGSEDGADLDFVLIVRERGTPEPSDDEIQLAQYSGASGNERIEKKIVYHFGGMQNPDKESAYVYHFDGMLDQIHDSRWDYVYNPATNQIEKGGRRLEATTTYKTDASSGEPRIDKITDAFTIKNHFYTSAGKLERVEEVNGVYPNRITKSYYNSLNDVTRIEDFYGRNTYFEYVKNDQNKNIAAFETNDQNPDEWVFKMFTETGETQLELDSSGRLALFDTKPHSTQLGKVVNETRYFLEDTELWLSPWIHDVPKDYAEIMRHFDLDQNGKIDDSDVELLFNQSNVSLGARLHRDKTYKLLNQEGDIVLSLSPKGELSLYDYSKDIVEAKKQTQWHFYTADALTGHKRVDLDNTDLSASDAWNTLGEKVLKAGVRDYEELTSDERIGGDQARQNAVAEFLISVGTLQDASDLIVSKTFRQYNSGGELIEEQEASGLVRKTVYQRDVFGIPSASFTTNTRNGALIRQEFSGEGEGDVKRQELANGLVKEFTYEKNRKGITTRIIEKTYYPHDVLGTGSTEIRELNLAGEVTRIIDKNGVITDIVTRETARGEKEIEKTTRFTDSFGQAVRFTELEKTNRYGHTVYQKDKNGREVQTRLVYNSMGRVSEATEVTDYVTDQGQAIHYEEFFRFNDEGEQIFVRDKNGREIEFEYIPDAYGNLSEIRETELLGTGSRALTIRKKAPTGENIAETDKNGFTTRYAYDKDSLGNVIRAYEIQKLRYDFSEDGQVDDRDLEQLIAQYGNLDTDSLKAFDLTRDGVINEEDAGRLTLSKEYGTREVSILREYSPFGDLLSMTDRNGRKMNYQYEKDDAGRVKRSIETNNQFQGEIFRVFDNQEQLLQVKDQNGNQIHYLYTLDSKGNVLASREEQELAARAPPAAREIFDAEGRRILWEQGDRKIITFYNPDGSFEESETDSKGLLRETDRDAQDRKSREWSRRELGQNLARNAGVRTSDSQNSASYPPSRLTDGVHDR
ncbi:MAG: hypothetical protein HY586_01910, partial [Candidatus Omnitrophica bacterium]|nr:hypothetical protein [Candidatus Omnitrophota bacterium]